jgi:hypothetical protein
MATLGSGRVARMTMASERELATAPSIVAGAWA